MLDVSERTLGGPFWRRLLSSSSDLGKAAPIRAAYRPIYQVTTLSQSGSDTAEAWERGLRDLPRDEMLVISDCGPDPAAGAVSLLIHSKNNRADGNRGRLCSLGRSSAMCDWCVDLGPAVEAQ